MQPLTVRKLAAADAAINSMLRAGGAPAVVTALALRLAEIQATKQCPRRAAPDKPCPLCHAVDDEFHDNAPRQCG